MEIAFYIVCVVCALVCLWGERMWRRSQQWEAKCHAERRRADGLGASGMQRQSIINHKNEVIEELRKEREFFRSESVKFHDLWLAACSEEVAS